MSVIDLSQVKADLRVTHDADDALLQTLLDASEDEAARFLDVAGLDAEELGDSDGLSTGSPPPSLVAAVFLLVRSKYDTTTADEVGRLRQCAETLMMPYRINMGV